MIKRSIFNILCDEISGPEIIILLGARQVGKTTLMKELELHCQRNGLKTAFFDLEQPNQLALFNQPEQDIQRMLGSAGDVVFIDEFQYIAHASKIFKAIFDAAGKPKIVCSGSSSLEIHKHLKESLAGRRFLYRVYPLAFSELQNQVGTDLDTYLTYGGMPGLTHAASDERRQQMLSELLSTYILKDIRSLVKEENLRAFNHLLYLLAEREGSILSVHSAANEISMSSKAVNRYLDLLEGTYVLFRLFSYSGNLGNELKKSCKTYFYDPGIRNALLRDFSGTRSRSDRGALYESFVFLSLSARLKANMELKFWRTKDGQEVDFILLQNRRPFPVEVKTQLLSLQVPKGLAAFLKRYPETTQAFVVNRDITGMLKQGAADVRFLTFEELAGDDFFVLLNR
jgi:predicted AAA+ superfamily ATPase